MCRQLSRPKNLKSVWGMHSLLPTVSSSFTWNLKKRFKNPLSEKTETDICDLGLSRSIWIWKTSWMLGYLKVLLELVKTFLRPHIGPLGQTGNSGFCSNLHEKNPCFLNNMIVGFGRSHSVPKRIFSKTSGNIRLFSLRWPLTERYPICHWPNPSSQDGEAEAEREQ